MIITFEIFKFVLIGYGFVALGASSAYVSYAGKISWNRNDHYIKFITIFAFTPSIDCGVCADPMTRQASNRGYVLSFVNTG